MTQEAQREKNYFQFNRGINTEQSELTLEDGFSVDEANYELLTDGSRRRRRGLRQEASGGTVTVNSFNPATDTSQSFKWRAAGGSISSNFIVHKIGSTLYFTTDSDGGSASVHSGTIDLDALRLPGIANDMDGEHLDHTVGRGVLFISGKYIYPTAISYSPTGDSFSTEIIEVQVRDYRGIDDGVAIDTQVESGRAGAATLAQLQSDFPDHYYNLLNRGWNATDILLYESTVTGTARYPAKQQWWVKGYRRSSDTTVGAGAINPEDGTYAFNADKLNAEIFGGSDAPRGSMIVNIFDDTTGFKETSIDASGTYTSITGANFAASDNGDGTWDVTVTDASHTFVATDEINWKDKPIMFFPGIPAGLPVVSGATSTVKSVNAGVDWTFEITDPGVGTAATATFSNSSYWGVDPVARSSGTGPLTVAPKAIEFHGGRLWYAGVDDTTWASYIYFSQVIEDSENYKRCHTDADPTAPNFNSPVITDGGFLLLPDIGNVKKLLSLQDSLLIFSDQGIWEVRGKGTFFDPSDYVIRKITDAECGSAYAPILIEGVCVYTSPKGVYMIAPDQYTRQLTATNMSDDRIREQWLAITDTYEPYIKTVYDDADKKLYFLQPGTANQSTSHITLTNNDAAIGQCSVVWVYDLRVGAWYKYIFNQDTQANAIIHAFALTGQDSASGRKKVKFAVQKSATTFIVCDFSESSGTGYQDFDGNTVTSFVLSHYEGLNAPSHRKQAPIVTVYSKRTVTGYTSSGGGWAADNPSSTTMTAYWDWTDDSVSGKIGSGQEVYRDVRGFVPSGATDVDGYPVVVTRNKVRGRGRVLQLKFAASIDASGEDSHILGYTVNYKVSRRK